MYHRPNLCVANVTCTRCMHVPIAEVDACEYDHCQMRFRNANALEEICEHLMLSGLYTGAVCLAHNASRYDKHFIQQFAVHHGAVLPKAFESSKLHKGYFPNHFNMPEN